MHMTELKGHILSKIRSPFSYKSFFLVVEIFKNDTSQNLCWLLGCYYHFNCFKHQLSAETADTPSHCDVRCCGNDGCIVSTCSPISGSSSKICQKKDAKGSTKYIREARMSDTQYTKRSQWKTLRSPRSERHSLGCDLDFHAESTGTICGPCWDADTTYTFMQKNTRKAP